MVGVFATVVRVVGIVVAVTVDATVVVGGTVIVVVVGGAVVVLGATVVGVVVGGVVIDVVVVGGLLAGRAPTRNAERHAVVRRGTVEVGAAGLDLGFVGRVEPRVTIVTRVVWWLGPSCAATNPTVASAMTRVPSPPTITLRRRRCRRRFRPIVVASS